MIIATQSAAINGVEACSVEVEINATGVGQDTTLSIIGLPDAAVRESRGRVWSAVQVSHFRIPDGHTTINLAPADLRKSGTAFDLPIALCLISATTAMPIDELRDSLIVGELSLDGQVRPVSGVLPMVLHAKERGISRALVPFENALEAGAVKGIKVYGVKNLHEAVLFYKEHRGLLPVEVDLDKLFQRQGQDSQLDFIDVKGQEGAKRALMIAVAGNHNALMIGSPGVGKSLIANRLPSIMPPLTMSEALEVTKVHSIAGCLPSGCSLIVQRPFRAPHHTVSDAGLLGGGKAIPHPGELSLAHCGVLFLDELPEFRKTTLEALRQPLENGEIRLARSQGSYTFPARIMLVAAMNPCPCGYFGSPNRKCTCLFGQVLNYRSRLSGPLIDRIDIQLEVPPLTEKQLLSERNGENSASMRAKVWAARERQKTRFQHTGILDNAAISGRFLDKFCPLNQDCKNFLLDAIRRLNMSARSYDRILRVSRTIADLDGAENISEAHISEAMSYRCLDRPLRETDIMY